MTANMIWTVTAIYLATSISFAIDGNRGMSLCFLGYAVANIGIIWSIK